METAEALVLASFAADSLALGAHWIYDTGRIEREIGRVDRMMDPPADTYHPTKARGDFTHYGDQALLLLESVARGGGFNLDRFAEDWRTFFGDYTGYRDHATRETLINMANGAGPEKSGSQSTELGGASRIAPLVFLYRHHPEALLETAKAQTAMTHAEGIVVESAAFFARLTLEVLEGKDGVSSSEVLISEGTFSEAIVEGVRKGTQSAQTDTRQAIGAFGQMCAASAALPGVMHLVARYPDDLQSALVENVMAGGDSAARGMIVGMVLGARLGMQALPDSWVMDMKETARIRQTLERLGR